VWFKVVLWRRRRRRQQTHANGAIGAFLLVVSVGILVMAGILQLIDTRLKPTIVAMAEAMARVAATDAMNKAINTKVAQSIKYEDLMSIKTDNRGKVALVQPNTGEINRLSSVTAIEVQRCLGNLKNQRFSIPLGQALNSQAFAHWGPKLWVTLTPIGSVSTNVTDSFEQAGINQTRHRIYLEVKTVVKTVIPLVSSSVEVSTRVPLTEAVIMGEVPQVYFGTNGKSAASSIINNK
jgi:sporulation protein YunB